MTEGSQMENGEWKMENEIFIDDCNVCKCEYYYDLECKLYKNESSEPEDTTYDFCKEHPLCEYKATAILKRLEQENKANLKQIELDVEHICNLNKRINELEQENKELKIWLESKEKQLKHLIEYNQKKKDQIKTLKFMLFDEKEIPKDKFTMMYRIAQNERRTRSHRDLCTNITNKYRSALEEIRDLCIHYENTNDKCITNCYAHFIVTDLILNKIKEVLNDN